MSRRAGVDRVRLRKLLGMLGSTHDGEVLNAARLADALVKDAGTSWDDLLPGDGGGAGKAASRAMRADRDMIDALLNSKNVHDVVKLRLKAMRAAVVEGRLGEADRLYLRVLHRKAVIDGTVIDA